MESLIFQALSTSPQFLYSITFISLLFEANTILFSVAFLTEHGVFKLQYIFPVVFLSSVTGSLLWYYVGYLSLTYPNIFSRIMHAVSKPVDEHLKRYTLQTLFLTKFIYGLNCAAIVRAGQIKIPIGKFIKYEIITSFGWIIIVGFFGYISGDAYRTVAQYFKYTEIGLFIAIILFILIKRIIAKYAREEIES